MDTDNPQGIGLNAAQEQIATMLEPDEPTGDEGDDAVEETEDLEASDEEEEAGEPTEDEETGEEEEQPRYTVKVDGEDVEVTFDELVSGYSRQADYTRKTQKLTEERKEIEAERAALKEVEQERKQYSQLLSTLKERLEAPDPEPDWDAIYEQDPGRFALIKHKWDQQQAQKRESLNAVKSEQERIAANQKADWERQRKAELEAEEARIPDLIPEWKDQGRREKEWTAIKSWMNDTYGEDPEGVVAAGGRDILRKAWLYDQGKAKAKGAKPQPSPTLRPGQPRKPTSNLTKAKQRLAKTGRVQDAAGIIESMLE
jgi:hypothetical protein